MSKKSKRLKGKNYKLHHKEKQIKSSLPEPVQTTPDALLEDVAKKGVLLGAFACFSLMMLFGVMWFTSTDSVVTTQNTSEVNDPVSDSNPTLVQDLESEEGSDLVPVAGGVFVSCSSETTKGGWLFTHDGSWNPLGVAPMDEQYRIPVNRESEFVKYWNNVVKKMNTMTRYTLTHKIIQEGKPDGSGTTPYFITESSLSATLDKSSMTTKSCRSSISDPALCADPSEFIPTTVVETHPRRNSCTYNSYTTFPDGTIEDVNANYDVNSGREEMGYREHNPLKILGFGEDEFTSWVVGVDTDPNKKEGTDSYGKGLEVVYVQRAEDVENRTYIKVYVQNGVIYKMDEYGPGILQSTYMYKMR